MNKRTIKLPRGSVDITPGILDAQSEYAFSGGHCHSLACAIARAKDLDVVVLGRQSQAGFDPMHVLVEVEAGKWADVNGVHDASPEYLAHLNTHRGEKGAAHVVSLDELPAILKASKHKWLPEDPMLAGPFVEPVLARWGMTPEIDAPGSSPDSDIERELTPLQ